MVNDVLYTALAPYYDRLYQSKDYAREAALLCKYIHAAKTCSGNRLLDLACGTGGHLQYLQKDFECTGIDRSEPMLVQARKKIPDIQLIRQDMLEEIPGTYDVIICMFSSIAYVGTYENLRQVIRNVRNALNSGGVLIVQPWFQADQFTQGILTQRQVEHISCMSLSNLNGLCSRIEYHYLIRTGDEIRHFQDVHEMALFDVDEMLRILDSEGMAGQFLPEFVGDSRGMIVGRAM